MKDIYEESSTNDDAIKGFIDTIRCAHTCVERWRKSLQSQSSAIGVGWRELEGQKKTVEDLLIDIGWQAIRLFEAGEFEDPLEEEEGEEDEVSVLAERECEDSSEDSFSQESSLGLEVDDEDSSCEEESRKDSLDVPNEEFDVESFDIDSSESVISEEDLCNFQSALYISATDAPCAQFIPAEDKTSLEAWEERGRLLHNGSSKEERDVLFRSIGSSVDKGYFARWKHDTPTLYNDIVRFFISSLLYIKSFPRSERPESALGDKAFDFVISQIPVNKKMKRKITRYKDAEDTQEDLLARMELFWNRVQKGFSQDTEIAQQKAEVFNEEVSLHRFKDMMASASVQKCTDYLLRMVQHGMSSDPRLIRILHEKGSRINLNCSPKFSALRRALRSQTDEQIEEVYEEEWEHAQRFYEKSVIVIGGEKKRILLGHFADIIPQAHVDWVPTSPNSLSNRVQSLKKSIELGGVDFVLVIKNFISHSAAGPLFKAAKMKDTHTHVEMITDGYGKRAIKCALVKCLQAKGYSIS